MSQAPLSNMSDEELAEAKAEAAARGEKAKRGLEARYIVERVDGKPVEWAFVLELHDPIARLALQAYIAGASTAGYHKLADDLQSKIFEWDDARATAQETA